MPEHLTRRELKTDLFALSVESAANYFGLHRRQLIQIAAAIIIAAVAGLGIYGWLEHNATVRSEKLAEAMQVSDATIGPQSPVGAMTFTTQQAKDAAVTKAFSGLAAQYHGSKEAAIAEYTLANLATGAGRNDEARKHYQAAVDEGGKQYASLAKLALAQLDFSENKVADGEKLLRDLIANPTDVVSKEQASVTLARMIARTRPAEARALLAPIAKETGETGQMAQSALSEISAK